MRIDIIARLAAVALVALFWCSGFAAPCCALPLWRAKKSKYRTSSSWRNDSFRTQCVSKGNLSRLTLSSDDNVAGTNETTHHQRLRKVWVDFKFGALHVHTNYLDLFCDIYSRVFVFLLTFVLAQIIAYSISPSVSQWAVRSTLQALFTLAEVPMVLMLPWIVFRAVVLRAMLSVPTLLASLLRMIPNQAASGAALTMTTAVDQLTSRLWQMLRDAEEKMSKDATLMPMLVVLSQRTKLGNILLMVVTSPIVEELYFRYFFNYMRGKLARILHFSSQDENALISTALCSFIFACAHITNWVSPNMNAATVVDTDINTAILASFAATSHFISSFFVSQFILFPVYDERGLAASIGAHASWNALILTINIHVPVRLWLRAWNRLKRSKRAS